MFLCPSCYAMCMQSTTNSNGASAVGQSTWNVCMNAFSYYRLYKAGSVAVESPFTVSTHLEDIVTVLLQCCLFAVVCCQPVLYWQWSVWYLSSLWWQRCWKGEYLHNQMPGFIELHNSWLELVGTKTIANHSIHCWMLHSNLYSANSTLDLSGSNNIRAHK